VQRNRNPFSRDKPADEISLRVIPIIHGGFGVYADSVLIAIHADEVTADVHRQRLRNQQAIG
jgi:hypothetical protein